MRAIFSFVMDKKENNYNKSMINIRGDRMQKLNTLGVELLSLKEEMLNPHYPSVVQKALKLQADDLVKNNIIDVDVHLALTDPKMSASDFSTILFETPTCRKTQDEMLAEFEEIRKALQAQLESDETPTDIQSQSIVETDQIAFIKTFKLTKQWVSDYFGQPPEEVGKLMLRNGFVEKFAVLRLARILEGFLQSDLFEKNDLVDCKATRVFYDLENDFYGIHLMFYLNIEDVETDEHRPMIIEYIRRISEKATEYVEERIKN